jgi:hypothetical protein
LGVAFFYSAAVRRSKRIHHQKHGARQTIGAISWNLAQRSSVAKSWLVYGGDGSTAMGKSEKEQQVQTKQPGVYAHAANAGTGGR